MPAPKDPEKYKLWRERLKAAKVGFVPWNKSRKYSNEPEFDAYRKKLSENSGSHRLRDTPRKKLTLEHRANLSKARKGRRIGFANGHKHTEATRKKMSASQAGKKRGPLSEEQRLKISNTLKRARAEHPELFVRGPVSEEQKAKQSESMRRFYATGRGAVQKQKLGELAAARQNGKPLTEVHRQAISKANKETFSDPEIRNDLSTRSKAMWDDPDTRQKLLLALNTDEARTAKSEAAKQLWDKSWL